MRASLLAIVLLCACKPRPDAKNACLAGDTEACVRACAEGVAGEGGCFTEGERSKSSDEPRPGDRAFEAFRKGCLGGHLSSCTEALERARRNISFEAQVEREVAELLDRACSLGKAEPCAELARQMLGRDATRALSASERYCKLPEGGAGDANCLETRKRWVAAVEAARPGCDAGQARACAELGTWLVEADSDDNAAEAFAHECELRGLDVEKLFPDVPLADCNMIPYSGRFPHAGARGRCGMKRALDIAERGGVRTLEPRASLEDAGSPDAGALARSGARPRIDLRLGEPRFPVGDYPDGAKLIKTIEPLLSSAIALCVQKGLEARLSSPTSFEVRFMIDRFGEPTFWSTSHVGGPLRDSAIARFEGCVGSGVLQGKYPPPPGGKAVWAIVPISLGPTH